MGMVQFANLNDAVTTMENVLRWFARGVHSLQHLHGREADDEVRGTFEHVDSRRLDASGFHASDSMGLPDSPTLDLADTRAGRLRMQPASRERSAVARVGRGFAA
jgi:hypothetical protein